MRKRRSRAREWAVALAACVAILLMAWGVSMAVVMGFARAWAEEPRMELTEAELEIVSETLEQLKGE